MPIITAIIVTYHSDDGLIALVQAIAPQVTHMGIVDNASGPETIDMLKRLSADFPSLRVHYQSSNLGLAAAQNIGMRQALADGAEWVLLLDDDSIPAADMVEQLLATYQTQQDDTIGILAPKIIEQNVTQEAHYFVANGWRFAKVPMGSRALLHATFVIASGSLLRVEMLRKLGGMIEPYFIDAIDHEYCLRALDYGYTIAVVGAAHLQHHQGEKRAHSMLGANVVTAHYGPLRRYYIFRNRVWMLRAHGHAFPFLWAYTLLTCGWDLVRVTLLESDKKAKLKACMRGFWHGVRNALPTPSPIC